MNEFIQSVTGKFGIDESAARSATGGVLEFLKGKVGHAEFSQLTDKLPGASSLLDQTGAVPKKGGGLLGGLMDKASAAVGVDLGDAAGLVSRLKTSGLDLGDCGSFVSMFVEFARKRAGDGLVESILGKVPELKKMIG